MPSAFVPGIELARCLHRDVVGPLLVAELGEAGYAAALLGPGSEVLGFDTVRSTDHDWGPRLQVFLPRTVSGRAGELAERIRARLPTAVAGHATAIAWSDGHEGNGVQLTGLAEWLVGRLGVDPRTGFGPDAWLAAPTQALAEVTGGAVLHDPADELTAVRRTLAWYPADVWRCVLAGLWSRIAEEEPFVGRAGEVGDVLGSGVLTARLARDLMRICPLLHRRYPPYSKWLGSAFGRLPCAPTLRPAGSDTAPVLLPALPRPRGGRFADALLAAITDPRLAGRRPLGAVDCYLGNTLLLTDKARVRAVAAVASAPGRMSR